MDNKKTIVHVIESLALGGAEKSLVQNVNAMPEYRNIVVILNKPDVLKNSLTNAKLINLNSATFFQRYKAIKKLRKIIVAEKADLVHAQLFNSTLVARMASKYKVPFVFTLQSMLGEDLFKKDFISRMMEKLTYSKKNYIIAVSNEALYDYEKYIKVNKASTKVIYNSIETKFFADSYKSFTPGRKIKLVAVGNLKPLKNYDYMFDALRMLDKELVELDVYGDGPHSEILQKRIEVENLPVILKGNVSDLDQRIKHYDIYLHCSKYEGSSLAIFEAMASGLPLIVSDIPVLQENTGGYATYVDLKDPTKLGEKIISIQQGELEINEKGRQGFEWVKTVAQSDIVITETLKYYTEILDENKKSKQ